MATDDPLPDPRSGPEKDAALVQRMFDRVAPRYDLANSVFSLGQDRHWRRVAVRAVQPQLGEVALDVAAGTGMLAHELRRGGATVVALDFSFPMLAYGAAREAAGGAPRTRWLEGGGHPEGVLWCNGDGMRLPLADASVDVVTIAFGLRNLPDPAAGLAEFARVTRPGGRLAVLEFSSPKWRPFRAVYHRYLLGAIPQVAKVVTSDPAAYRYLAESILEWPDQNGLARLLAASGWEKVRWKNLTGGVVAVHAATRG